MDLETCIRGRRSIRAYKNEPVLKEQIETFWFDFGSRYLGSDRDAWRILEVHSYRGQASNMFRKN
jgi:nitroreductase